MCIYQIRVFKKHYRLAIIISQKINSIPDSGCPILCFPDRLKNALSQFVFELRSKQIFTLYLIDMFS